jgi:hypothetical protein
LVYFSQDSIGSLWAWFYLFLREKNVENSITTILSFLCRPWHLFMHVMSGTWWVLCAQSWSILTLILPGIYNLSLTGEEIKIGTQILWEKLVVHRENSVLAGSKAYTCVTLQGSIGLKRPVGALLRWWSWRLKWQVSVHKHSMKEKEVTSFFFSLIWFLTELPSVKWMEVKISKLHPLISETVLQDMVSCLVPRHG